MFLRFLVIVDSYQEKISCIATQRIRIFLFLNLLHRSLHRLVPLQLHNKRRIVISVLRFWNENEVCEAPACGQLSNRLKVILHSAQVCNRQDAAQGVFIVVLDGRNIVIMDFLNLEWLLHRHPYPMSHPATSQTPAGTATSHSNACFPPQVSIPA